MSHPNDEETRSRGRPVTPEADLRAALAEATLTLLLKGGYGAATVDAVAKEAGVAKKTLYRFAANRDELVAQAVRTATLAAALFSGLGMRTTPQVDAPRTDIIQALELGTPQRLIAFCQGIQAAAPVDSYVTPEPWDMPGYDSQVIMAAGAFIQGSSIELSADGPLKEPYAVYFQGGLTWYHAKYGIMMALEKLVQAGIVTL